MTSVKTACPYCGVGCGVLAKADGTVSGDPDHPANFGRLCSKGTALGETVSLEGRLLAPRVDGVETGWDPALDLVAERFRAAVEEYGPDSVAFYVSGQLLTEDYYVANKLIKGYIGSANIDTNSRLCMASSVAGHKWAFGSDTVPGQYADFEEAEVIVLVGSNLAWCHPVLFQRIVAAKKARPGLKVVVIDPRRTATAKIADLHLSIRPDGDAALFNLLLEQIDARGLIDADYTAAHVDGLGDAVKAAHGSDRAMTGLSDTEIDQFLDLWCGTDKVVTLYSQGVNQSVCGTDKVNAILNCHLATGRIGKPGCGPFSITGQPNAMGGREVGGLANMLACHLDLENADHRHAVQTFWASPAMADAPGLKAVDLFQACADGKIKALWIMSTNPAVSMPDADKVVEAIRAVPFTVASDIVIDTDTNRLVDVLLPATGWGEKSGTVTNSERCISRQRAFLPAPGQARPDWDIIADVGRRMGWHDAFDFASEAEVFREYAALSSVSGMLGRDFDISGLADLGDQAYDAMPPTYWPVPRNAASGGRFFADGGFYHPGGKARMLPITPPDRKPVGAGLRLNTGRVRDHWHTMTRTGRSPRLGMHMGEPYLEIHPEDAVSAGLRDAELAVVENPRGRVILRVLITAKAQLGSVFAPMHWTDITASQSRINALVDAVTDPVSGQPASKGANVTLKQFEAGWYGFAVSAAPMEPTRPYAAIARCKSGWRAEVAGVRLPESWESEARAVLNLPDGEASVVEDPAGGVYRVAIHHGGQLLGLFFAACEPVTVARSAAVALIGTETPPMAALAGVAGAEQPDRGATICACFDIGSEQIRRSISDGARTVDALGACLGAGSNCGSCRPELQDLIDAVAPVKMAAE
ncbi:nitrate reductase [Phaeobacter marinintestinus]|uniref:nitrate reductase n=1 Tax=Falsiphaeobacter marinintestinus TaxID=1492905 RepID=UPI0011B81688|nr:nitrate reductase [Phaeobacter marinintestinus]